MAKTLTEKIKKDYGTVKHFCKKNSINWNTFKVVTGGKGTSDPIVKILVKHGYIESAEDLKKEVKVLE